MSTRPNTARSAAAFLKRLSTLRPSIAIILGSGFQSALRHFSVERRISYSRVPGFSAVSVDGHRGEILLGRMSGVPVIALCGRVHFHEGYPMETVVFPIRVLAEFGVQDILLTNAAGGIRSDLPRGAFMILRDHINLMGVNPLRLSRRPGDSGFVDLTDTYSTDLQKLLLRAGRKCGIRLKSGTYIAVSGPSYETPAEIRAFARLGADAVGMSTVPEAIVARHHGMRVAGLSCITNRAAGLSRKHLSHAEVLETGMRVEALAAQMLKYFIEFYGQFMARRRGQADQ
ncbi:MAG: purine-nucleoside phosphorylase [Verrucomicrobiota bacterium]